MKSGIENKNSAIKLKLFIKSLFLILATLISSCAKMTETTLNKHVVVDKNFINKYKLVPSVNQTNRISQKNEDGTWTINHIKLVKGKEPSENIKLQTPEVQIKFDDYTNPEEVLVKVKLKNDKGLVKEILSLRGQFNDKKQAYLSEVLNPNAKTKILSRIRARVFCLKKTSCERAVVQLDYKHSGKYWTTQFFFNSGVVEINPEKDKRESLVKKLEADIDTKETLAVPYDHNEISPSDIMIGNQTGFTGLAIKDINYLSISDSEDHIFEGAQLAEGSDIKISKDDLEKNPKLKEEIKEILGEEKLIEDLFPIKLNLKDGQLEKAYEKEEVGEKSIPLDELKGIPNGNAYGYSIYLEDGNLYLESGGSLENGYKLESNECLKIRSHRGNYSSGILAQTFEQVGKKYCKKYPEHKILVNDGSLKFGGIFWKKDKESSCKQLIIKFVEQKSSQVKGRINLTRNQKSQLNRCLAHKSHQNGMDIDVSYLDRGDKSYVVHNGRIQSNFNPQANYDFIKMLINSKYNSGKSKIAGILVNTSVKKAICNYVKSQDDKNSSDISVLRKIIPYSHHKTHMHIRFACPPSSIGNKYSSCAVSEFTKLGREETGCESFELSI